MFFKIFVMVHIPNKAAFKVLSSKTGKEIAELAKLKMNEICECRRRSRDRINRMDEHK